MDGVISIPLLGNTSSEDQSPAKRHPSGADPFVLGPENHLVEVAIRSVLEPGGRKYHPLVIHGASGTGKSHLAWGLASAWRARFPRRSVQCKTAHDFLGELTHALETQAMSDFHRVHRRASLLVLEDVGRLAGKETAQEELVQTLDILAEAKRQVVVTAALPPGQMPRIGPRLQSRLAAGLSVPLVAPAPATRQVLLKTMLSSRGMEISTPAARLLAASFPTAPELLGAVKDLQIMTARAGRRIDVNTARQYLAGRNGPTPPTLEKIAQATARAFSLRLSQLRSSSRSRAIVTARGVAMYLARKLTEHSLQQIGLYFGGRDHTTVLHGCRKTEILLEEEPEIRLTLETVREQL